MEKKSWIAIIMAILLLLSACTDGQKELYDQAEERAGQIVESDGEDQGLQDKEDSSDQKELAGELTFRIPFAYSERILAEEFMKLHPDVTIMFLEYPIEDTYDLLEFADTLAVELMSGNAADIVSLSVLDYPKIARNGLLCDLNAFMEEDQSFHKEDYFTNIFEALEVDEKLYAISMGFSTRVIWLDKAVTDALGTDMTQFDSINMDQILDMYEEAERQEILPDGYMLEDCYPTYLGGMEENSYYNWQERTADFKNPQYVRFLKRIKEKVSKPKNGWSDAYSYSDSRVPEKKNCFMFSRWYLDASHILWFEQPEREWNAPIPYVMTNGKREFFSTLFGVYNNSPNKELAWEYLKYCISEKNPADYGRSEQDPVWYKDLFAGVIPINRTNCRRMVEYTYSGMTFNEEVYDRFLQIAEACNYTSFVSSDLQNAWGTLTEDFYYNDLLTAEEYTEQMQERTEMYFRE